MRKLRLSPSQLQQFEAHIASDREQYEKVTNLAREVATDSNSRLPFIPAFYRSRPIEEEQNYLETVLPKVEAARADEFCLSACRKEGPSCISTSS